MAQKYTIPACCGRAIDALMGQTITVIDLEGGQVVDFFAESAENPEEFLSPGVTIDCNESLRISVGNHLYLSLIHISLDAQRIPQSLLHPGAHGQKALVVSLRGKEFVCVDGMKSGRVEGVLPIDFGDHLMDGFSGGSCAAADGSIGMGKGVFDKRPGSGGKALFSGIKNPDLHGCPPYIWLFQASGFLLSPAKSII